MCFLHASTTSPHPRRDQHPAQTAHLGDRLRSVAGQAGGRLLPRRSLRLSPRAACRLEALGVTRVYDYVEGIADWKAAGLLLEVTKDQPARVADATRTDVPTCRPDTTIGQIRSLLANEWNVCVVVDCDRVVVGRLRRSALGEDDGARVDGLMEAEQGTVRPDSLLDRWSIVSSGGTYPMSWSPVPKGELLGVLVRDEAMRLLAGDTPEQIWAD